MALYVPHSIFHLARLLCVRPENFGPYYVIVYDARYINCQNYGYVENIGVETTKRQGWKYWIWFSLSVGSITSV